MYFAAVLLSFLMAASPFMLATFGRGLYKKLKNKEVITEADITVMGINIILFIVFLTILML